MVTSDATTTTTNRDLRDRMRGKCRAGHRPYHRLRPGPRKLAENPRRARSPAAALEAALEDQRRRRTDDDRPIAFLCLEYGIHPSLPIYSGGLGVLAGDILKEASDRGLPMIGIGLLYWQGSYHQRLDPSGWQHDYWTEIDHAALPMALVTGEDGAPLTVTVPVREREVVVQAWRVDVGRVPLYLL